MPDLLTASLMFIGGLILLGKGSDFFVEAAARIAKILGVSEFVIGLTLIAIGTSLPELAAGIVASYAGETEIVLGNVVGSNIANIALIMGASALIAPLLTEREMFYRDGYILLGVSSIFYYFAFDRLITGLEGVVLISLFSLYTAFLFRFKPSLSRVYRISEYADFLYDLEGVVDLKSHAHFIKKGVNLNTHFTLMRMHLKQMKRLLRVGRRIEKFPIQITDDGRRGEYKTRIMDYWRELRGSVFYELLVLSVSGFAIYLGAEFFIGGAVDIAEIVGIAPSIVGLTIVSIGTSMPELVVALQSARKGFGGMVIGNLIGSNIANITLIIGVCSLITPVSLGKTTLLQDLNISYIIPFMISISFIGVLFIRSGWVVRRYEGFVFISLYLVFLLWLLSNSAVLM